MGTVRFLLALCVVSTHSPGGAIFGITMMSGITAVQCFYVISGFLITMILNERSEYQNLKNFYLSRYLRLWPVYILVATLMLFFFQWPALTTQLPTLTNWWTYAFIVFSNLTIFFQDWFVFLRFDDGGLAFTPVFQTLTGPQPYWFDVLQQAWTLGVELTFYAIAPFVCRRWWGATGLLAFGISVRWILASHFHIPMNSAFLYRFAPAEMTLFGAGAVMYFAGRRVVPLVPKLTTALCIIFVMAFVYVSFFNEETIQFVGRYFSGGDSPELILMNYPILVMMALALPSLFHGTRSLRFDRLLGEMSYPMYICHIFVFGMINAYLPASFQVGNAFPVVMVLCVSLTLVFLIVLPLDRLRHRLGTLSPILAAPVVIRANTLTDAAQPAPLAVIRSLLRKLRYTMPKIKVDPFYYKLLATASVIGIMVWGPYLYFVSKLDDLLHTPGINGGPVFWAAVEGKLYKLADAPDLPPEQKEKIVEALQKLSAKYHPYFDALISTPKPKSAVASK